MKGIPLDEIINYSGNIYEKTSVAIKEAERLWTTTTPTGVTGLDAIEATNPGEKLASIALSNTFNDKVEYTSNSNQFLKRSDTIISE